MTVKSRGFIPDKIFMFHRAELVLKGVHCTPAFPVRDGATETALTNARSWAAGNYGYYKWMVTNQGVQAAMAAVQPVEADNHPRGGFRVVDAEQRGEGGRAWKVITPDGDLVDMREDVFLPILLKKGLPASGVIDAKFQWCQNGSQLRLEEVGSKQHSEYIQESERAVQREKATVEQKKQEKARRKKTLSAKVLQVGHLYETVESYGVSELVVFLGRVRHDGKLKFAWIHMHRFSMLDKLSLDSILSQDKARPNWQSPQRNGIISSNVIAQKDHGEVPGLTDMDELRKKILFWARPDDLEVGYEKTENSFERPRKWEALKLEWAL